MPDICHDHEIHCHVGQGQPRNVVFDQTQLHEQSIQGSKIRAVNPAPHCAIDDGLSNPSSISSDENAVEADFLAGKSAFAVNWLFQYSDSNDKTKSQIVGQAAFAPMPVFQAGLDAGVKGSSVDGSSSFAVMATTPYPDQTWKFLTYLASNEVQTKYSKEMLPVWQTDFEGEALKALESATETNPVTVPAFLAQFPYANERPTVPYYNEASAALQLAIQEALTGVKSPKDALDEAAAKWVELAGK